MMINGFEIQQSVKEDKMHLDISSRNFQQMEALLSKIKEWIQ